MRMSKKVMATGLTCLLTTSLLMGNVQYATHTFAAEQSVKQQMEVRTGGVKTAAGKAAIEKEESVYVTLDANGKRKKVIVSDWLKNSGINGTIDDVSALKDIQNTKGNEKFTQSGSTLTWEAGKDDIYYQGTTDEELPISMEITYKLDGKEITPKELLGKSGKVEIKIQYINNSVQTVKVGGKEKEVHTPFLMATGMFLPVDNFSNVKVDNGRVLSEGDNDIVAVYGTPGLKESLDLDNIDFGEDSDFDMDKINEKLTDSATITADVTDFEMGQTYTVATPNLFNKFDLDEIEDMDDLDEKLDDLKEAVDDMVDGTDKINDGLETLDDNFGKYDEFYNYKKNELEKTDKDKLVYIASTYEGEPILKRGYLGNNPFYTYMNGGGLDCDRKTSITSNELCLNEKDMFYQIIEDHSFKPWDDEIEKKLADKITKQALIDEYCHKVDPSKHLRVFDNIHIGVNALILAGNDYEYDYPYEHSYNTIHIYPRILNIPMTLYKLEEFLHGNFYMLDLEELKQVLTLYKSIEKPIYSVKIQNLTKMYKYLPIPGVEIESQIRIHNGDEKVIRLLKK